MILDFQQIRSVTTGAVYLEQQENGIHFCRFTRQQQEMLSKRNEDYYKRAFGTAGIRLRFCTDSTRLALAFCVEYASVKSVPHVDISVNGVFLDDTDECYRDMPKDYLGDREPPYHTFKLEYRLDAGLKEICIYLPWCAAFVLQELSLSNGASVIPVPVEKRALCFGDSITHGAEALRPRNRYISRFCDYLGAVEYSKAICGEKFWPELANTKEPFDPDYITVAYGTNDWSKNTPAELRENCFGFYRNLIKNYPNAKLIAITPTWRADEYTKGREITLADVHDLICQAVKDHPNATVIRGYDLVPHDITLFEDFRLHPNDDGFDFYYKNLVKEYKKRAEK